MQDQIAAEQKRESSAVVAVDIIDRQYPKYCLAMRINQFSDFVSYAGAAPMPSRTLFWMF